MDTVKSKMIFEALINGRVINAHNIGQDGKAKENPLFTEIMTNLDDYTLHFERCGKTLSKSAHFFVLRENNTGKSDVTIKMSVLLLMLGKYLNVKGWSLTKVSEPGAGLTEKEMAEIGVVEDGLAVELMKKADITGDVTAAYQKILVDRGVMHKKVSDQKYVLSDSGISFYNQIFQSYKEGL